jgi:hypothetical protein
MLTIAYLQALSTSGLDFGQGSVTEYTTNYSFPAVIGYCYTSQGQILRPLAPQATGAQNGPALAKTRRVHMIGFLVVDTQGVTVGTNFTKMYPMDLKSPGGIAYNANQLVSGIYWNTIQDDNSFDGMVAWQSARMLPATISSINVFLQTQDR